MSEDIQDAGAPVVSIETVRARTSHATLNQIEAYWEGLRQGRLVPDRQDVDPRGLTGALSNAFVLERIAPGLGRFRVSGGHLTDLMGMEVRGMPVSAMFEPTDREGIRDALEAVFSEPAVARLQLLTENGLGRPAIEGEMILLPLKSDLGDVTRVLGGVVLTGEIGRTPRRFKIAGQTRRTLIGYGAPKSTETPAPVKEDEPVRTVATKNRAIATRGGFLKLVSSDGERVD